LLFCLVIARWRWTRTMLTSMRVSQVVLDVLYAVVQFAVLEQLRLLFAWAFLSSSKRALALALACSSMCPVCTRT
jgi:hypothetical protein